MAGELDAQAIYRLKAGVLALVLVWLWILRLWLSPSTLAAEITLAAAPALLGAAYLGWRGRSPRPSELLLSLVVDVASLTVCIHLGGGADQVSGVLLYAALVLLAGMLVDERAALALALTSAAMYDLMIFLEYVDWLPHRVAYRRPPDRQVATATMVTVYLGVIGWMVFFAFRRQRLAQQEARRLRAESLRALAHDLKNPLASIHGYASLLAENLREGGEEDRAEARNFAERISAVARDAVDLVHNVLDTATSEPRPLQVRRQAIDMREFLSGVAERARWPAEERGVVLELRVEGEREHMEGDGDLLHRALSNLLHNALRHTPAGGRVQVGGRHEGGRVVLWVADSGSGIDSSQRTQMMQRMVQGLPSVAGGSGLGLLIVKKVAEGHGGSLEIDSEPAQGSTFRLILPQPKAG